MRRASQPPRAPRNTQDVEVYKHLTRLVAIGQSRREWDAATVVRVAETFLPHPHILRRQLDKTAAEVEIQKAEVVRQKERANRLRERVQYLESLIDANRTPVEKHAGPPLRTVVLRPDQFEILELMRKGLRPKGISEKLGVSYSAITNRVWRINRKLGAHSQAEAVALVLSGAVDVQVSTRRSYERNDVAD